MQKGATWLSYSSLSDFIACPQRYYYKNVYRNPATGNKIQIMAPALALGQAVHGVLESLAVLPTTERLKKPLMDQLDQMWVSVSGKRGGFTNKEEEAEYRARAGAMLQRAQRHPGPLSQPALRLKTDLPKFDLSTQPPLILCGKLDWLEYVPDQDGLQVIDFKTGKRNESPDSLQLPIYVLLAQKSQRRPVLGVSYWYLDRDDEPIPQTFPDIQAASDKLLEIGGRMHAARAVQRFNCQSGGDSCRHCRDLLRVATGEGEFVGQGGYNQDIFIVPNVVDDEAEII